MSALNSINNSSSRRKPGPLSELRMQCASRKRSMGPGFRRDDELYNVIMRDTTEWFPWKKQ